MRILDIGVPSIRVIHECEEDIALMQRYALKGVHGVECRQIPLFLSDYERFSGRKLPEGLTFYFESWEKLFEFAREAGLKTE